MSVQTYTRDPNERCGWPVQLIGASSAIQSAYKKIRIAGQSEFSVLVYGETGTGKELAARVIHDFSCRRKGPFVPIDCAALAPTLIESELFGHAGGAFTGAQGPRIGLLEAGNRGTIFFDEIGEMPLCSQAKLLRCVQEHNIRPVGSNKSLEIDVRYISATNRNLETEVNAGRFRQDLFFRLNVLQIGLPALRNRKEDIPILVKYFFERFSDLQPSMRSVSEGAMRCLMSYSWPGNIRELENAIEHALALGAGPTMEACDLPSALHSSACGQAPQQEDNNLSLKDMERRAIFRALSETGGDRIAAARLLKIGKTTLYRKLKQYGRVGRK